jgi:hypothetical protein
VVEHSNHYPTVKTLSQYDNVLLDGTQHNDTQSNYTSMTRLSILELSIVIISTTDAWHNSSQHTELSTRTTTLRFSHFSTLIIMELSITKVSTTAPTLSITTLRLMIFSIMALSITIPCIKTLATAINHVIQTVTKIYTTLTISFSASQLSQYAV